MRKIVFIIALAVSLAMTGCTSDNDFEKGKKQLENMGYTDVENTGYNAFCCSDSDNFSTGFKAKDKEGNIVRGCFCSSLLKGITIRFE
jgi:hypothetical protein